VHIVGFIIRIYHDVRSPERQIHGEVGVNSMKNNLHTVYQDSIHRRISNTCVKSEKLHQW